MKFHERQSGVVATGITFLMCIKPFVTVEGATPSNINKTGELVDVYLQSQYKVIVILNV